MLLGCMTPLGVDRVGDRQHRWGFLYDERDGTGLDARPALVRHTGPGDAGLAAAAALDRPPLPERADRPQRHRRGRTVAAARTTSSTRCATGWVAGSSGSSSGSTPAPSGSTTWESCLSWLPMTEAGDAEQDLGYLVDQGLWPYERVHYPAVDLDHSEWDDPDYQVLAFRGQDHPFGQGRVRHRPGRGPGPAGTDPTTLRLPDPRACATTSRTWGSRSTRSPRFDQCMYTLGFRRQPATSTGRRRATRPGRSALSFDLRGDHLPQLGLMAFPGEEPPQIECNEDAGGVETDE